MADVPAAAGTGRAPSGAEPGLIRRRDLVAALDWAAQKRVTIISAPAGEGGAQLPPVAPSSSGSAMVDKVPSELEECCDRFVLVIDDLHELSSPEAAGQLTALLTRLAAPSASSPGIPRRVSCLTRHSCTRSSSRSMTS